MPGMKTVGHENQLVKMRWRYITNSYKPALNSSHAFILASFGLIPSAGCMFHGPLQLAQCVIHLRADRESEPSRQRFNGNAQQWKHRKLPMTPPATASIGITWLASCRKRYTPAGQRERSQESWRVPLMPFRNGARVAVELDRVFENRPGKRRSNSAILFFSRHWRRQWRWSQALIHARIAAGLPFQPPP